MPQIEVQLRARIEIADDKKITLGNLASCIKEQNIDAKVLEGIIHTLDAIQVYRYCGGRYERGNGDRRYQRAGTAQRSLVTSVGKLNLSLHKVIDLEAGRRTGAGGRLNTHFRPIEDIIQFDGKRIYQEDISMIGVELATKMTYRDTVKEAELFTQAFPCPRTLNSRVIEYGDKIKEIKKQRIENADVETVFSDGTKTHSQEVDRDKNEVNVVLGKKDGKKVLLDVSVNRSWKATSDHLYDLGAISDEATIIGDADKEMRYALIQDNREFQLDLIHTFRDISIRLWKDDKMGLDDRKAIIKEIESILYPLKNSVNKHMIDGDIEALRRMVNSTVDELKKIVKDLLMMGCTKTAAFIRDYSNFMVTFARLAVEEGREVPWNSNIIERLMGEISKRVKHKWMRWTTRGLEAILNIILIT